jgi:hypothetical protein
MIFTRFISLLFLAAVLVQSAFAQLPATDLFMIHFSNVDTQFSLKKVSYLSAFNPLGYNNQPKFIGLNELYLSSDTYSLGKSEVIKLDLFSETLERMTMSKESDFSPSPLPNGDGLSTVRIEQDGVTQTLWAYNDQSFTTGARLFENISTIGYYNWLSEVDIAMFLLPDPFTLYIGNINTGISKPIIENIGRCLKQDDDGKLLFTHVINKELRYIKSYDLESDKTEVICQALVGSEDFEIINNGALIMANNSKLYYFDPAISSSWTEVLDLSEFGISDISRLAYSGGRLVLVSNKQ